jgi:hypothetical protein
MCSLGLSGLNRTPGDLVGLGLGEEVEGVPVAPQGVDAQFARGAICFRLGVFCTFEKD